MKKVCSICARGGSKGLKNKNILPLLGKPLILHSLEQARASGIFDALAVSSDSDEILNIAEQFGVDYIIRRPIELASDTAPKIPAIRQCAQKVEEMSGFRFDLFVDLDCTSPLRTKEDIISVVELLTSNKHSNIFSVTPARRSPYFDVVEVNENNKVVPCKQINKAITRRQDTPDAFDLNASIYVWNRETLMNSDSLYNDQTGIYIMPNERSVEIDGELEFHFVEFLMRKNEQQI